ncbi:unnamed protein product [Vitrella brassicaformis CCMP3155]|uniref:Uncharacterized protein n=1 Tax=Vitrella brassicaformis (strain CCMP3155) TaxID=1169540 RepID=A0A0G4EIG3_VITBC|nr:unnamed protein product [Vitrella brassicaformis CCMP3155]|eukprot:CEL95672.1 unnamed protein product [Vitrella brassicaformis CCMP3155]
MKKSPDSAVAAISALSVARYMQDRCASGPIGGDRVSDTMSPIEGGSLADAARNAVTSAPPRASRHYPRPEIRPLLQQQYKGGPGQLLRRRTSLECAVRDDLGLIRSRKLVQSNELRQLIQGTAEPPEIRLLRRPFPSSRNLVDTVADHLRADSLWVDPAPPQRPLRRVFRHKNATTQQILEPYLLRLRPIPRKYVESKYYKEPLVDQAPPGSFPLTLTAVSDLPTDIEAGDYTIPLSARARQAMFFQQEADKAAERPVRPPASIVMPMAVTLPSQQPARPPPQDVGVLAAEEASEEDWSTPQKRNEAEGAVGVPERMSVADRVAEYYNGQADRPATAPAPQPAPRVSQSVPPPEAEAAPGREDPTKIPSFPRYDGLSRTDAFELFGGRPLRKRSPWGLRDMAQGIIADTRIQELIRSGYLRGVQTDVPPSRASQPVSPQRQPFPQTYLSNVIFRKRWEEPPELAGKSIRTLQAESAAEEEETEGSRRRSESMPPPRKRTKKMDPAELPPAGLPTADSSRKMYDTMHHIDLRK